MERHKFVYLAGLLPIAITSLVLLSWSLLGSQTLQWLGLVLSPLCFMLAFIGSLFGLQHYFEKQISVQERKQRRKHFIGHTLALSLGLAFSFQSFNLFRVEASRSLQQSTQLEVVISNTSMSPAKNIEVRLGEQVHRVKEVESRKDSRFHLTIGEADAVLTATMGSGSDLRQAEVVVDKSINFVRLRLDPQQNILPELQ